MKYLILSLTMILFTGCASKRKLIIGKDCYYGYRDINGTLTKADHSICEEANKEWYEHYKYY